MNMGVYTCGHLRNVILVLFCVQNENENKVRGKHSMICYETTSIVSLEEQQFLTFQLHCICYIFQLICWKHDNSE